MSLPTRAFDVESTKDAVARRIEAGDISREDVDVLQRGYRNMTLLSSITSVAMAIPTYYVMKRRVPPYPLGVRMLAAGGMGMLGSFLGFSLGGVGAAMEVNRKMQDPQKKMRVFQEIAAEAQKTAMEHRGMMPPRGMGGPAGTAGGLPPRAGMPGTGSGGGEMEGVRMSSDKGGFDYEAAREQAAERERERDYSRDVGTIERDSTFAGRAPDRGSIGSTSSSNTGGSGAEAAGSGTTSTWDRLRAQSFPQQGKSQSQMQGGVGMPQRTGASSQGLPADGRMPSANSPAFPAAGRPDERTKEQREFDEMLEKERQGVPANEVWR